MVSRRGWRVLVVAAGVLAVTGCGSGGPGAGAPAEAGFPMEIRNCDQTVTVERRPERILTSGRTPVDLLHAVGASDRIVARSGEFGLPVQGEAGSAVRDVPILAPERPTAEVAIGSGADLLYTDIGGAPPAAEREQLRSAGVSTLLVCGNNDEVTNFDDVVASLEMLGRLMGTEPTAAAAEFRRQVDTMRARNQGRPERSAVAVSVFRNTLYGNGNQTMLHAMTSTLGLRNVFGQTDAETFEANVEQLVNSDPDVVVLAYGTDEETFEDARQIFTAAPGVATMRAVQQNAIIGIPFSDAYGSTRSVKGLTGLANALDALPPAAAEEPPRVEELLARDPDVVVLLSYGQTDAEAENAFLRIPGVSQVAAARNDAILVQPYEYSSQGRLSVNGLENMAEKLSVPQ